MLLVLEDTQLIDRTSYATENYVYAQARDTIELAITEGKINILENALGVNGSFSYKDVSGNVRKILQDEGFIVKEKEVTDDYTLFEILVGENKRFELKLFNASGKYELTEIMLDRK